MLRHHSTVSEGSGNGQCTTKAHRRRHMFNPWRIARLFIELKTFKTKGDGHSLGIQGTHSVTMLLKLASLKGIASGQQCFGQRQGLVVYRIVGARGCGGSPESPWQGVNTLEVERVRVQPPLNPLVTTQEWHLTLS